MHRSIRYGLALLMVMSAMPLVAQPPPTKPDLTPLNVQLDWKPTAQFAGILVAKQKGFYAAEGLDVTIIRGDGDTPSVDLVARNANDAQSWVGITEADLLLAGRAKGLPLKAFATMMQTTPFALLTLKDSGLTTIKSLKGKTIGLHDDGEKAIDVLLQFNGMTRSDVTIVKIPYSNDALLNGAVSAMQGYVIDEAVRLHMEHHPVNIIPMGENGYVSYAEVLFAPDAFLQNHPETLARFLRATARGWKYAGTHADETAQMIVAKYAPESSIPEQKASLLAVMPLLSAESPRFGAMRPATWDRSIEMFETYKLVDGKLSAADAVDYSVLKSLYSKEFSR
jgi:ABC-type nitrate/sulfonate/bicarbonate transport system substrate-binding protein